MPDTQPKAINEDKKETHNFLCAKQIIFISTVAPHIVSGPTSVKHARILFKNMITTSVQEADC